MQSKLQRVQDGIKTLPMWAPTHQQEAMVFPYAQASNFHQYQNEYKLHLYEKDFTNSVAHGINFHCMCKG